MGGNAAVKKKALTLFAVLLCALVVLNVTALADFGDFSGSSDYDFSYDYSDNDSSWSSSSSSSGSSYYDDDGYVSGDANPTRILIMALIVVVAIVYSLRTKMKNNSTSKKTATQRAERAGSAGNRAGLTPIGAYAKIDPNFNSAALCEKAANLYVQMQNGWTAKNIESLRPYFTDALFTQMERSLRGYVQRGETNVVERIAVLDVTPLGFRQTGGEDHILLRLRTRITDYTVQDSTQKIVRGSRDQEKFMTYEWDLLRPTGTKTDAASGETKRITCPGCGAPLDVNASARCPYCGTVIQQQAQDWVISAIRGIRQETV